MRPCSLLLSATILIAVAMVKSARRQSLEAEARHQAHSTVVEGLRKREAKTTLQSAIELRAKRDGIQVMQIKKMLY